MGENGLVQDGPGVDSYSCHGQVFAVLAGTVTEEEGKRMLEEVTGNPAYAQCSVSMSFYLFRALEKVGLYEKTKDMWNLWREMLKNNMTTCVENNTDGRSDCHAWDGARFVGKRQAGKHDCGIQYRRKTGRSNCIHESEMYDVHIIGDCAAPRRII